MPIGIKEDIVRFDIPVNDTLAVNVSQGAAQLGNPKANGLLGESLPGYVKAKIAAAHQVNHQIPGRRSSVVGQGFMEVEAREETHMYSMSWKL